MNALYQAQSAYGTHSTPVRGDRSNEYDAFARITRSLKQASQTRSDNYPAYVQALHLNRRLWSVLGADVADSENALPKEIRGQIFYLAEFAQTQTRKILRDNLSAETLIELNLIMMRGLAPKEENS